MKFNEISFLLGLFAAKKVSELVDKFNKRNHYIGCKA